ncbi:DUF4399 domain-containing protein [Halovivax gelatinilyticus]|uniref:DUF4399 domain-containing protein n=1 Tax=Halovivax gelatinilyticus TaxID=2961597 RepID=UPI0020CA7AED|nr:DUF4399 domain-containing protein [Halovivax gelatinilyticus]
MNDVTRRRLLAAGALGSVGVAAGCLDGAGPAADDETEPDDAGDDTDPSDDETADPVTDEIDHEDPTGSVAFVEPEDGDTVESPFTVELEVTDFDLVATGDNGELADDTGHHHILIDREPVDPGEPITDGPGYLHLDGGEEEMELDLSEGEYTLIAQPGDSAHVAFDMTDEIAISVENGNGEHDPDDEGAFPVDDADDAADDGDDDTDDE